MSFFTSSFHPFQFATQITQEDFTASSSPESTILDILNDEGAPLLVSSDTATKRNSSRRASTSSCSNSDTGLDVTTPMDMDDVNFISPRDQGRLKHRTSIRHVVRSTHDSATNQHVRVYGIEISEYEGYSPGEDMQDQETETVLVNLSPAAEVSRAIMTNTNINLKLVAAGAKESFKYRVTTKVEVKTWIRQAAFIHDDELQCYIRRNE
ncbi:hypothetical protein L211DRAFT_873161 [Terfezia boudieri ATCC MYA-4762]|uniref:Uncharacterized protein n=1 Tax=Terfezia boudieri ATCC MYA-4762 TaxID=1051890 RepID=A0A3N4M3Q6_9PEZI|nr:hypothetical protein L211DRAFT_873161 [Terfezia boudieri ATCC MYA-4762]